MPTPIDSLTRHNENKDGTIGPREETKKQVEVKNTGESNDRPQTPTSSDVRGNSFRLEFLEEKEQREFMILWDIKVPRATSEGPKIEKDLCCLY